MGRVTACLLQGAAGMLPSLNPVLRDRDLNSCPAPPCGEVLVSVPLIGALQHRPGGVSGALADSWFLRVFGEHAMQIVLWFIPALAAVGATQPAQQAASFDKDSALAGWTVKGDVSVDSTRGREGGGSLKGHLPPARRSSLRGSPHSHPSTPPGGYDVPVQFQARGQVDSSCGGMPESNI